MMLARVWFYPPKPAKGLAHINADIAILLIHRLQFFGIFAIVSLLFYLMMHDQKLPDSVMFLATTTYVIVMGFILVSILWLVNKLPKLQEKYRSIRFRSSRSLFPLKYISIKSISTFPPS